MSRKTREIVMFGQAYRTKEFAAVTGMEIFSVEREFHPFDLLAGTEAYDAARDIWVPLNTRAAINTHVVDHAYLIAPRAVLQSLTDMVYSLNFDFAASWKGVKVPGRFREGGASVASIHIPSMFGQLINNKIATLQQLEEYYSLRDAFVMFDSLTVASVNEALAQEAASQKKR